MRTGVLMLAIAPMLVAAAACMAAPKAKPVQVSGRDVYERNCAACHDDHAQAPGTIALATRDGNPAQAALTARDNLDPTMVAFVVRHGVNAMPPFRKSQITDGELSTLTSWLASQQTRKGAR